MIFTSAQIAKVNSCFNEEGKKIVTREFLYQCNSGSRKCGPRLAKQLSRILGIPKEKIRPDIWGED